MRLEGSGQLKNPVTSSGTEPATIRLVAKCLNQLRYRVPLDCLDGSKLAQKGEGGARAGAVQLARQVK
jgi:hypothetical protein